MNDTAATDTLGAPEAVLYTLWQLIRHMLDLGLRRTSGPRRYMYRDLVERRHCILEGAYKEGLALAQLMPGFLTAQLAIYLD